jgi:hypothetical protein
VSRKLPSVTSDIPRDLRQFIDRVREILSGNTADRYVTAREIVRSGAADVGPGGALVAPDVKKKSETPAQPQNFTAAGALQNIILTWDNPNYVGHAHAEIYRSATDGVYTGTLIGTAPGRIFTDAVGYEQSYFYWIRFVNDLGVAGPYFSAAGVFAQTGVEVDRLLDVLTGQITESQLFTDLGTKINSIDSLGTAITDLTTQTNNTATTVQTLSSTVAGNTTSVQTLSTTVDGISGAYTVKIDNNGYVTGFGLASTANDATPFSEFAIRADRFYVASPSGPGITPIIPFVVNTTTQTVNGVTVPAGVYMDAAYIKNGTITNAKIGNASIDNAKIASLSADKITAGTISADRLDANVINAKVTNIDAAVIGSGTINSARIGDLSADKIVGGTIDASNISGVNISGVSISGSTVSGGTVNGANIIGGSMAVGTGNTPYGHAITITSTGVLFVDNVFGGVIFGNNFGYPNAGVNGSSFNGNTGVLGAAVYDNTNPNAHGVRGINYRQSTSGLVGVANGFDFYAEGAGTNYGPFTGSHDSLVPKGATFTVGDIVVDVEVIDKNGISSAICLVAPSSFANQKGGVGVVCKEPTPLNEHKPAVYIAEIVPEDQTDAQGNTSQSPIVKMRDSFSAACELYDHMAINSLGEGQINVCGEGGDIEIGDLIVTSSILGKGMKQADDLVRNITVAKSRQNVAFSGPTEVKQIACIYMCG